MKQQTAVLTSSAKIVRWHPSKAAENDAPECQTAWRDNVVRKQAFEAAHPDVIWPPRHGSDHPWVAYVPMPDSTFLEVTDTTELGRLLDKLAVAIVQRDAQPQQAA
jgi:hypothetical protein